MRRIDSHHHIWRLDRGDYGWLSPASGVLFRDYDLPDLKPLLDVHAIDGTVLVQAAPTEAETRFLLEQADAHSWIEGVVGWTDLAAGDASERVAELAGARALVGLRPMLQDLADPRWILRPGIAPALRAMAAGTLVFDALVRADQIDRVTELADRHPHLSIVLDHAGKPAMDGEGLANWNRAIAAVAQRPNTRVKLSGLVTEIAAGSVADPRSLRGVVDELLEAFGPKRIMWGSDWPVLNLTSDYGAWHAKAQTLLAELSDAEQEAIFGGTAIATYGLIRASAGAVIVLDPRDNVGVCARPVAASERVTVGDRPLVAVEAVNAAHKIALHDMAAGAKVVKYGIAIGSITRPVQAGEWVHLHNMKSDYLSAHTRAGRSETAT